MGCGARPTAAFSGEGNKMELTVIHGGGTNKRGDIVTVEKYDRGTYIEIIKKVERENGQVDIYVDKKPKENK